MQLTDRQLNNFWAKVNKTDTCWLWTGAKDYDGYGKFTFSKTHKMAHRLSLELFLGSIEKNLQVDHLCRVRHCVNPAHLEAVTPRVNTLRSNAPSAKNAVKTECLNGHPFTEENTYYSQKLSGSSFKLWRQCKTCVLARQNKNKFEKAS
jgi:hypothetical protein